MSVKEIERDGKKFIITTHITTENTWIASVESEGKFKLVHTHVADGTMSTPVKIHVTEEEAISAADNEIKANWIGIRPAKKLEAESL